MLTASTENENYTFRRFNQYSNQLAQWTNGVYLTFSLSGHKQIVHMTDDFPCIQIDIFAYWSRHAQTWIWKQCSQPVTINIHTIFDGFVFAQLQWQPMTDNIHAPIHLQNKPYNFYCYSRLCRKFANVVRLIIHLFSVFQFSF